MSTSYYRLVDEKHIPNRWYLKGPLTTLGETIDPRAFTEARAVECAVPLTVPVRRRGIPLDFTLADFDMPVLRSSFAMRLRELEPEAIQLIPSTVAGEAGAFDILNVLSVVDALDEERSAITYWREEDGRPERVGQYRMVLNMTLDPSRIGAHHVFRIKGWEVALVVSATARERLIGATGAVFELL